MVYFSKARKSFAARPEKNAVANAGPSHTRHRNLAIRLISAHVTASASTFLLDEWPILNFVFEVDFFLSSKREVFFDSSLKAQPSPKPTNNALSYVHTEQFPNGSGQDQVCSHGTGTEKVRYQSTGLT